jgi:predicted transcriptional regulator
MQGFCNILYYKTIQMESAMPVTSIRLHEDIEAPLEELAKKMDRSRNYVINQAIREFVARQSMEEARWADTQAALASVANGETIPEGNIKSWLESWGSENEQSSPEK